MMSRARCGAALLALALAAVPAGLAAPPPPPALRPSPTAVALAVAARATGDHWAGALADAPGRAALGVRRAGRAALSPLLPAERLAEVHAWQAWLALWSQRAHALASVATMLDRLAAAAGGRAAAADRALDAAALGTAAVFAVRLARRPRAAPRR